VPVSALVAMPHNREMPLAGITIIDFTFQAAGPYATMLLAALGAEVIKIESSVRPDPTRGRENRPYVHSVFFEDVNLGKKSVTINMKKPAGVAIAGELIGTADAVTDNFRPGVMDRWRLSAAALQQAHPRLVVASLSSTGSQGPLARLPGYAGIFNALGGLGGLTGYPGGPPTEIRTSVDMRAGALFATSILFGLLRAKTSGTGPVIDFSAAEAVATLIGDQIALYTLDDQVPARGETTSREVMETVVRCSDELWLAVAIPDLETWGRVSQAMAEHGIAVPASIVTYADLRNLPAGVASALAAWLASYRRPEAVEILTTIGAIAGPVMSAPDIAADRQHQFRTYFQPVPATTHGRDRLTAAAPWLLAGRPRIAAQAPDLGEHTRQVMAQRLARTEAEIDALITEGVLA
jgi:crotonobetainyl-CoA:carnitine CoA-transferase CaiB-like acyl-CoA transferase